MSSTFVRDFLGCAAVNNAQLHGRPPVVVRVWSAPRRVAITVTDTGTGPTDPYAGLLPRPASPDGGLGLWMARTGNRWIRSSLAGRRRS
jgi:hypothetical protein